MDPKAMFTNAAQAGVYHLVGDPRQLAQSATEAGLQAVPAGGPLEATFDLGNSTTVRKRFSVLIHSADFADLSVCTFTLEAGAPLRTYRMVMHASQARMRPTSESRAPALVLGWSDDDRLMGRISRASSG